MKRKFFINRFAALLAALVLGFFANSTMLAQTKKNISGDTKMKITEVINNYEQALNASSTEEVMKLYGTNPVFMPQHSTALEGRDAVKAGYDYVFQNIKLNVKFTVYEIEEFGNLAFVRTSSAGETTILANKTKIKEGNNELFIFRQENGVWKIHRYLFATTNPPTGV